jgi:hypothetical protein
MATMLVRNLLPYSIVVYSWNDSIDSVSFQPYEIKDCSGIQINKKELFANFFRDYIKTGILTLIPVYETNYVPPILADGYFDFGYIDYGWID